MAIENRNFQPVNLRKIARDARREFEWKRIYGATTGNLSPIRSAPGVSVGRTEGVLNAFGFNSRFMQEFVRHAKKTGEWAALASYDEDETNLYLLIEAVSIGSPDSRRWDADSYRNGTGTPRMTGKAIEELIVGAGLKAGDIAMFSNEGPGQWMATFRKREATDAR